MADEQDRTNNDPQTPGQRLVEHMRGRGTAREIEDMTTDEIMDLLRGERAWKDPRQSP